MPEWATEPELGEWAMKLGSAVSTLSMAKLGPNTATKTDGVPV